ncbi:MAG: FAD-dependent monooxygenase [Gammaproteobacteria bacterium]|nr:FAD-dependent monooxygenase [Gammaproteobacteria bacterium]MBV9726170.1 FAD-dependent monooxygenase [Gammaproteobacteria bacterium]
MFDVIVVGGGPVGACVGALLAGGTGRVAGLSVALLEPRPPGVLPGDARPDLRVVALSRASERLLKRAGAWGQMPSERLSAYERMRIWHESIAPTDAGVLVFDAADVGEPNLGYIAEGRALQTALLAAFAEAGGHIETAPFSALAIGEKEVQVSTPQGALTARLVIGADGAQSALRAAAGLAVDIRAYGQTAIVANVATTRPHESTAWQRFMRDGTLAFLPLADGSSSIVWSADDARAAGLVSLSDTAFAAELDRASDLALGTTRLLSQRLSFPLMRVAAQRYVAQRVALIGDAAHVVHPLAGQGVNLGLLDAAALAQEVNAAVAAREDPGALRVLRAYERWRKSEVAAMAISIDTFDRLLAHGAGPLARLMQRGLSWVNASQELRRFFIRRALGLSGELPEAAR